MDLVNNAKWTRVSNAVAAGTTDVNSTGVDMNGYDDVTFVVDFGAITATAVTSVKAQQSDDDAVADAYSDLEGTSVSVADDDDAGIVVLQVHKPLKRYVRCVIDRGTENAVIDTAVAVQSMAHEEPVTQDSTVVGSEYHVSPAEGTA